MALRSPFDTGFGIDWNRIQNDLNKMHGELSASLRPANSVTVKLEGKAESSPKFGWLATTIRKWLNVPNAVKEMQATVTLPKPQVVECRAPAPTPPSALELRRASTLDAAELIIACRERLNDDVTLLGMLDAYFASAPSLRGVRTAALQTEKKKITLRIRQAEAARAQEAAKAARQRMKEAADAVKGKKAKRSPIFEDDGEF